MQQIMVNQPFVASMIRTPRILIVDDEDSVACVFQRALKRLTNYEAIAVTDSRQALQLFSRQHFDLLITDYRMPGMNGVALVKRIRQLSPHIPIIMITASDSEELYRQTNDLSIHTILGKPTDIMELHRTVLKALHETNLHS